jgi:hypothetical protein
MEKHHSEYRNDNLTRNLRIMAKAAEKKPNFPFKACPKCGNYIHTRSKSHEACGWKEGASPASKLQAKHAPTATNGIKVSKTATNGVKLSKMEAVRRVLKEHGKDTMPLDIQTHLKKQYSIMMDAGVISNYKSTILKKWKKPDRPKAQQAWTAKTAPVNVADEITIGDIEAVKKLVDRMGADKVRELAQVLGK